MINVHPTLDRVVVEPTKGDKVTKGGIHLPDSVRRGTGALQKGTVLAVGPGVAVPTNGTIVVNKVRLFPGAVVLYGEFAGSEYETDGGKKLKILEEREIQAVISEEELSNQG